MFFVKHRWRILSNCDLLLSKYLKAHYFLQEISSKCVRGNFQSISKEAFVNLFRFFKIDEEPYDLLFGIFILIKSIKNYNWTIWTYYRSLKQLYKHFFIRVGQKNGSGVHILRLKKLIYYKKKIKKSNLLKLNNLKDHILYFYLKVIFFK